MTLWDSSVAPFRRTTDGLVRTADLTERQGWSVLIVLIAVSTLLFAFLAAQRVAGLHSYGQDTAEFGYAYYQTLHGRLFPSFAADYSLWGSHPDFLMVLWLPIYWLVPTVNNLLVFQSLMISLGAIPVYLLARDVTGHRGTALIAAAGLLLFPPVARVHLAEIHDDALGFAALLFAFYFFYKKRFGWFAGWLAVSLLAKETIVLNTGFFTIYAILRRRGWRWVLFPALWSVGYFLVARHVIMPYGGDWWATKLYSQAGYFNQWGTTASQVVRNLLLHPGQVMITLLAPDRVWYLQRLLRPLLLVLPFGDWGWVTAVPMLAVNLLSGNVLLRSSLHWYGILAGGQLYASAITALPYWNRKLAGWFGGRDYCRLICAAILVACVLHTPLWLILREFQYAPCDAARRQAVEAVPPQASVLAPDNLLPMFASHPAINSVYALNFHCQDPNRIFEYEYIIFDANYPGVSAEERQYQHKLYNFIVTNPAYRRVFLRDNVCVYRCEGQLGHPPPW